MIREPCERDFRRESEEMAGTGRNGREGAQSKSKYLPTGDNYLPTRDAVHDKELNYFSHSNNLSVDDFVTLGYTHHGCK